MRPLFIFETPNKGKSGTNILIDRINDFLIPEIKSIGYKVFIQFQKDFGTTPMISIEKKKTSILAIPWIRPYSNSKTVTRTLNDYPRLNIRKDFKNEEDEVKISEMQGLVHKFHLYFLVVLQKGDHNLYWLQRYEDIPIDYWETTYRKKGLPKDRIHFPKYDKTNFVTKNEFKQQLNKIFR